MSSVHGMLAQAYWHTFHGPPKALEIYERAAETVRTSVHQFAHHPGDADARNGPAARATRCSPVTRNTPRSCQACRLCGDVGHEAHAALLPAHPLALREREILDACGRTRQALKFADQSCATALAQNAKYEHAQSLLVRARIAHQLGRPEAEEQIRTAKAALDEIEQPVRTALNGQSHFAAASEKP